MKRYGLIGLALLVALLLVACGNAAAPVATSAPTQEPAATAEDTPMAQDTATVPAPTATQAEASATATDEPEIAAPTATSEADGEDAEDFLAFLQVQPDDWVRGPDDAQVTIVEYADYQ